MTTIGKIESFDDTNENWETYVERVEQFFLANNIDDDHKVPTLLSLIGGKTYALLRDLLAPEKPATKSFQQIVTTLQEHLSPKPLEIAERFRFYKRNQHEGESILSYVAELRKLATHCNFGGNLNEALRDRLVCGLRNMQIQKRLLSEAKLMYSKAVEIAVAMETAIRDASELQSELNPVPHVDKLTESNKATAAKPVTTRYCYRCGGNTHMTHNCFYKDQICHHCGKQGHIQRVCRSKQQGKPKQAAKTPEVHAVDVDVDVNVDAYDDVLATLEVHNVSKQNNDIIWVDLNVDGKPLKMELDTGSAVSIISFDLYQQKFNDNPLHETGLFLKTYTGENITPVGVLKVNVDYHNQRELLDLYVVKSKGPVLMGRDWLRKIRLDWCSIKSLQAPTATLSPKERLDTMLDKYSDVFEDKLGTFTSAKAKLTLKEDSQPRFLKARQMPYALKPKVEEELRRLQNEGILNKVEWSEWATPIVPVPKKDGSVRLCGDYKVTVNPELQAEQYPLPRIEDIFANLAGGQKFSKIDLRQAYHQLEMEEDSKKYLTINTHMGLFQYNRLVFGITSAPAIWQRTIDQVLEGTSGTSCILDDMIITGKNDEEHLANLEEVLRRLQVHGLRANKAKCEFFKEKITFCGHDIDRHGLHKSPEKVEAVLKAPRPRNVAEVRSFLGLVNYYNRFFPNLSTVVHPLNQLLESNHQWKWTEQCETTFLLAYRNTPHSTTGEPPSQLFLGRRLRTRLDLLRPDLRMKISNRQIDQTITKGGAVTREFSIGQRVIARNYTGSTKWVPGIIRTQLGPLSYEVEVKPGLVWRRHTDQLRDSRIPLTTSSTPIIQTSEHPIQIESHGDPVVEATEQTAAGTMEADVPPPSPAADRTASSPPTLSEPVPGKRYPVRVRKPPARLDL